MQRIMATAEQVSNYILSLSNPDIGDIISNLKLQKLLYYCQGFHLAMYDKPLFEEPIEAWKYGPVVKSIYQKYKDRGTERLEIPSNLNDFSLTEEEKELINEVYGMYGQFSAWRLMELTHGESPWKTTPENGVITHQKLTEYFKTQLITDGEE